MAAKLPKKTIIICRSLFRKFYKDHPKEKAEYSPKFGFFETSFEDVPVSK